MLDLERTTSSSSTSSLELSSLGSNVGLSGTVRNTWSFTHMSACFSCCSTTLNQQCVLPCWCLQSQLVKCEDLPSCFEDTNSRTLSESESTDCQLGDIQESHIICHCSYHHTDLVSLGTSRSLTSSVTVPTTTQILSPSDRFIRRTIRAKEMGGLLILLINKRFKMTLLNLASVRRARNLYNFTRIRRYGSGETGASLCFFLSLLCSISIPMLLLCLC